MSIGQRATLVPSNLRYPPGLASIADLKGALRHVSDPSGATFMSTQGRHNLIGNLKSDGHNSPRGVDEMTYTEFMNANRPSPLILQSHSGSLDFDGDHATLSQMLPTDDQTDILLLVDLCDRIQHAPIQTKLSFLCELFDLQISTQLHKSAQAGLEQYIEGFCRGLDTAEYGLLAHAFQLCSDSNFTKTCYEPHVEVFHMDDRQLLEAAAFLPPEPQLHAACALWRAQWIMLNDNEEYNDRHALALALADHISFSIGDSPSRGFLFEAFKASGILIPASPVQQPVDPVKPADEIIKLLKSALVWQTQLIKETDGDFGNVVAELQQLISENPEIKRSAFYFAFASSPHSAMTSIDPKVPSDPVVYATEAVRIMSKFGLGSSGLLARIYGRHEN